MRAAGSTSVVVRTNGDAREHPVDAVLSSMPLRDLIGCLDPPRRPTWRLRPSGCATASSAWWR